MLKTAFKSPGRNNLMSATVNSRRFGAGGVSNTPHIKKSYDLHGAELDRFNEVEWKYEKAQRRWENVLDRKYKETERFVKEKKDNLFAKFKKEKMVKEKNMEDAEDKKD